MHLIIATPDGLPWRHFKIAFQALTIKRADDFFDLIQQINLTKVGDPRKNCVRNWIDFIENFIFEASGTKLVFRRPGVI
jgi:hypothetical protein